MRNKVGSLMVLVGWVLTFLGLSMTKTVRDHYYSTASWVVLYFGAFLLVVQLLVLMYVREFRAAYFAMKQGATFQIVGFLLILYGSRLPLMFHGLDESWFVYMAGLPMWVFGLELRFKLGTSQNIFFFVLSGTLPIACPLLWSECQRTRVLAFYFVIIQPAIYSYAYIALKHKRSRTLVRVTILTDGAATQTSHVSNEESQDDRVSTSHLTHSVAHPDHLRHQAHAEEQPDCAN